MSDLYRSILDKSLKAVMREPVDVHVALAQTNQLLYISGRHVSNLAKAPIQVSKMFDSVIISSMMLHK